MCRITNLTATALGWLLLLLLLPTTTTAVYIDINSPHVARDVDSPPHCAERALEWLAGCHIVSRCTAPVAVQASSFCSSYVHARASKTTTTAFSTVITTSRSIDTATQTRTAEVTAVETSTSTTTTTTTETSSTTTSTTSTTTIATSYPPPSNTPLSSLVKARDYEASPTNCPDLAKRFLTRRPAVQLRYACSCLGIQSATSTLTVSSATTTTTGTTKSTTTTTTTTSPTTTTTTTDTTTTTTTTTSTTTTSSLVASATAIVDACDITYNGNSTGMGNEIVEFPDIRDGRQCCVLCFNTANCVVSAVGAGYCQLLVKTTQLDFAATSPQCPLGIEDYPLAPGPGTLYRGPCLSGRNP